MLKHHHSLWLLSAAALVCGCSETVSLGQGVPADAQTPDAAGTVGGGGACDDLRPVRVPPSGEATVIRVAGGNQHTCFLHAHGSVSCTGTNQRGQLGAGSGADSLVAAEVSGLADAVDMDAGLASTYVVRLDGSVVFWGGDPRGSLEGFTDSNFAPEPVIGMADAVQVRTSGNHTCALSADGRVRCWGTNTSGEIGTGTVGGVVANPTLVDGLDDVVQIDVAPTASCALRATCEVVCWGDQTFWGHPPGGVLRVTSPSPSPVEGATEIEKLAVSRTSMCGVRTDGTLRCWGNNNNGQLGHSCDGFACYPSPTAQRVQTIPVAKDVVQGLNNTCVLDGTNQVLCFGLLAELMGGENTQVVPQPVSGLDDVVALGSGTLFHHCAIRSSGRVSCWGSGEGGQLGDGTGLSSTTPVDVVGL